MEETAVMDTGIWSLISGSGAVVQLVLLSLVLASLLCWAIIALKMVTIRKAAKQDAQFLELFWKSRSLDEIFKKTDTYAFSPAASVFKSGFRELQKFTNSEKPSDDSAIENIGRALQRASQASVSKLEKHTSWLATTASAAPFVGLFGTVWGIMNSFQEIGATGQANLAVVAPGISEALIATAVGLAAAIPAVVAYNHFANRIQRTASDIECFSNDFLNIIQRGLIGGKTKK